MFLNSQILNSKSSFNNFIYITMTKDFICKFILSTMACLATCFVANQVFQRAPITTDENSYVFQAYTFSEGKLSRKIPLIKPPFNHHMFIMDENHGWISRYAPGHALWLMGGAFLNNTRVMVYLAAFFSIWIGFLTGKELGIPKLIIPLLLLFSPFFLFMHGTLLSHSTGLLSSSILFLSYLRWRKYFLFRYALIAGFAWSWLYLNRTYTAAAMGLAFGIDAIYFLFKNRNKKILIGTCLFALSSFIGVFALFLYNYLVIGDPFTPTYLYYEPSENLGFGLRHTQGLAVHHTLKNGLLNLGNNIKLLNTWLFGFKGSAILLLALFIIGFNSQWLLIILLPTMFVSIAYIYFWYPGPSEIGPGYYSEILPFLIAAVGLGIKRIYGFFGKFYKLKLILFCVIFIVYAWFSLGFMIEKGKILHKAADYKALIMKTLSKAPKNSLIMLDGIPYPHIDMLNFNKRGLENDPLIVRSNADSNNLIAKCFPDKTPYLLKRGEEGTLIPLKVDNTPFKIEYAASTSLFKTGSNIQLKEHGDCTLRAAYEDIHGTGILSYGKYHLVEPGTYKVMFDFASFSALKDFPVIFDIATDKGRVILDEKKITLSFDDEVIILNFSTDKYIRVEPRVYYPGKGKFLLRKITVLKIS